MSQPAIVSLRLPGVIAEQVRTLAERADEKQVVILRRPIRLGLQAERAPAIETRSEAK